MRDFVVHYFPTVLPLPPKRRRQLSQHDIWNQREIIAIVEHAVEIQAFVILLTNMSQGFFGDWASSIGLPMRQQ
jgi:hypothetical protein